VPRYFDFIDGFVLVLINSRHKTYFITSFVTCLFIYLILLGINLDHQIMSWLQVFVPLYFLPHLPTLSFYHYKYHDIDGIGRIIMSGVALLISLVFTLWFALIALRLDNTIAFSWFYINIPFLLITFICMIAIIKIAVRRGKELRSAYKRNDDVTKIANVRQAGITFAGIFTSFGTMQFLIFASCTLENIFFFPYWTMFITFEIGLVFFALGRWQLSHSPPWERNMCVLSLYRM